MSPLKPYFIRALYEWIVDNGMSPYLLVNAEHPYAVVPEDFIENGQIVLNIRPEAIQNLSLGDDDIEFNARFYGKPTQIIAPVRAVLAIYAKENGRGMTFDLEAEAAEAEEEAAANQKPVRKKPKLRIVK